MINQQQPQMVVGPPMGVPTAAPVQYADPNQAYIQQPANAAYGNTAYMQPAPVMMAPAAMGPPPAAAYDPYTNDMAQPLPNCFGVTNPFPMK